MLHRLGRRVGVLSARTATAGVRRVALARSAARTAVGARAAVVRALSTATAPLRTGAASGGASREPADDAKFPAFSGRTELFIGNQFVESASGKRFATYNPGNGQVLAQVCEAGKADVDRAVEAATNAFYNGPWNRQMNGRDRGACLFRLADLLERDREKLAVIEALNNGKTLSQAMSVDAPACAVMLKYWAGWADKLVGQTIPIGHQFFCYTLHEPVGVVAAIVPWNLPLIAVAAKIGPALAAGNTVVLKTAEQTPLSALRLAEHIEAAGFPPGVINIVNGDGPTTGVPLVQHPKVDKVSFTGSVEVGKYIQREAAAHVKRVTLELGGKNPVVVCDDADLEQAVEAVHNGLFWNDGEACAAGSRIFVHDKLYDEFVARSVARAQQRTVGNPFHAASGQGAQVSQRQMEKVLGYIESAKAEGAKLELGGGRVGTKGYYIAPTVFSGVTDTMKVFREEVFGPVMTINRFKELDDVVRRANDTPYGLAAGVFTKDVRKGTELSRRIRAGMVFWNCYHVVDVSAPFGGFKQSGFGREGGAYGLLPYLEVKMVAQQINK